MGTPWASNLIGNLWAAHGLPPGDPWATAVTHGLPLRPRGLFKYYQSAANGIPISYRSGPVINLRATHGLPLNALGYPCVTQLRHHRYLLLCCWSTWWIPQSFGPWVVGGWIRLHILYVINNQACSLCARDVALQKIPQRHRSDVDIRPSSPGWHAEIHGALCAVNTSAAVQ